MSSRQLTLPRAAVAGGLALCGLVLCLALSLILARPADAQTLDPGQRIVATATQYLNSVEGQCFPWVRRVVEQALGTPMGYGYRDGYVEGGAVEVPLELVAAGDIIQIADDADTSPYASYPGLHTAIVVERQPDGRLLVIDSNSLWDGVVRLRPDYDPAGSAARYANLTARAWRFGGGTILVGNEAPTPSAGVTPAGNETPTPDSGGTVVGQQSQTLTPGGTARVTPDDATCVNFRTGPSLGSTPISCLADGTVVTVLEGSVDDGVRRWQAIRYQGNDGWMASEYLTPLTTTTPPAATPTPAPTAIATPTPTAPAATGTISGSLPSSGPGLIVWSGGSMNALLGAASAQGCGVRSVWITVDGNFLGYTAGAPAFVNQAWNARHPGDIAGPAPLIMICSGSAPPPTTSTPPPSGGTLSPPQAGDPPGPAGND